jgi:hypothetical protein
MLNLQQFGQGPYARRLTGRRQTSKRQQQLVLLGLKSGCSHRLLTEMEKPPNLVPKLREGLVILILNTLQ